MTELEKIIDYSFKDPELLRTALTHSSCSNEGKTKRKNNERLEFLGDSVLSVVVADHLFHQGRKLPEGELTRRRASLVCEPALSAFAREIGLGAHLFLGRGEDMSGGRERASILSDAFEALIAAIYLDGGLEEARRFILPFIREGAGAEDDYKTRLQEVVQKNPEEKLRYQVTGETGPDHNKNFTVEVLLNSNVIGRGQGHSKKIAEQQAAREALVLMGLEKQ